MSKQPRNAFCACGSGKKYKKCCYIDPPSSGVSLYITQEKPRAKEQSLRPRGRHLTTLALLAAAVNK